MNNPQCSYILRSIGGDTEYIKLAFSDPWRREIICQRNLLILGEVECEPLYAKWKKTLKKEGIGLED